MKIQKCSSCGEFRYIENRGKCRECFQNGEWTVVARYPNLTTLVVSKGLTKEKAERMVDGEPHREMIKDSNFP